MSGHHPDNMLPRVMAVVVDAPHPFDRALFDASDFDVPGEAEERAKRLGEKLGKA